jgi:hypothetical protein
LELEQLKKQLEKELLEKENLKIQIKKLDSENKSVNKTVICFSFFFCSNSWP